MRDCHLALTGWMKQLGMQVHVDAMGNLRGLYGPGTRARRLLLGSHLDSVPCAGAYDGVLGVCLALAVIEAIENYPLNFDVEVIGFSEEEGVRFRMPFLGSLAAAGCLDSKLLQLKDANGFTVAEAIRQFGLDPLDMRSVCIDDRAFAYLEFHIEQGPVLDQGGNSLAAVDVIVGQSRCEVSFRGVANHAGTTPMELRRDALAGAVEWIAGVERCARSAEGLVATVGKLEVLPGAGNIIPGEVCASLDVRHRNDEIRIATVRRLSSEADQIAARRNLEITFNELTRQKAVLLDERLICRIEKAMGLIGETPRRMPSGAGHDAMIMAQTVPSAMVFLRSPGGISHHPDETVRLEDVEKAIRLGVAILTDLAA